MRTTSMCGRTLKMAELRRVHLTISKGMKLYCTVEQASEDVIVVSLKHKTKEYRGVLLDSSERHLPPGLCFNTDNAASKPEGENADNSGADVPDPNQPKEARGVTLDCRYSYNNDPAKYSEQPLPTASAISIRPARGKQVRNIRLRPRQTLCSKCKAAIHDTKSKSPNKIPKPDGQEQETHPHNTRYRAALSSKPSDTPNTPPGPTLRSGARSRRADSTPKVLLENIRPKREVKPTAKKREADAAQKSRMTDASAKRNNVLDERTGDSTGLVASKQDVSKTTETLVNDKKGEEYSRVMLERSVSLDNPTALGQYNKQPVVRLDKSAVNNMNIRTEVKEEKQEKAPTISIVNIRSTPAIKITYGAGAGDRDVLKIPPRLPGAELKSPDDHSTADESPAPVSPLPPPSPPQKKTKKASRRTRDKQKQRYRIINDGETASEIHAPGIKIAGYHKKHKRKHKHRHASSEDENFNSEVDVPPPAKLPAIITKLSVVPSVNDLNGNEKKSESEVLRDSSNETPTRQDELVDTAVKSPYDMNESVSQVRRDDSSIEFTFDDDPLNLKNEEVEPASCESKSDPQRPKELSQREELLEQTETTASDVKLDDGQFQMWGSPVQTPAFEAEGSPTHIEAPPFQSDDSQEGLIVGPLRMGSSPVRDENVSSFDSVPTTPTHATGGTKDEAEPYQEEEKKEAVPYGVGMFEDLTPDEDEDDHDDSNVSQPMYQLPKKPRLPMYPGWSNDGLSTSSHVPGFLSKKSDDPSALYSSQTGVYQNGPNSFFSPGAGSSSMYPGTPTANFPSSPAPRIQNSPTPIIQKSPMPIFNYNASRYQSSPNRRFGSSPSRRYHSIGESGPSRQQSVIAGNLPVNHSRFQGHDTDRFQTQRESICSSSSGYRAQSHSESDVSNSSNRYPSKFDSQSTFRYQSSNEKGGGARYPSQTESIAVSRLSSNEENSSSSKSQGAAESSSALRYVWSSGDSGSLPRFAIPSNGNSSVPQYTSQGGTSSLPRYSSHPVEGSLPNQYPSLGSTETRFQPHTESRYKAHSGANIPSPLSLQKNSRSVSGLGSSSAYVDEKERKSVLSAPHYETVDTSALFMTHNLIQTPVTSDDNMSVPRFLNKPHSSVAASQNTVARITSAEPAKTIGVFAASPESNAAVPMYHQNSKHLSGTGSGTQGSGVLISGQEPSGGSISRHPSSSSLSQSNISVSISDSDDDSDSAVPGFVPTSGVLNSSTYLQDIAHVPMMKIQTQNLNSCLTEDGREIRVGDVQWGKVQGFPWWPCRVVFIKLTHRDHREQTPNITQVCHVAWFGSRTVSDLHPSELRPFREEFSKRHVKKKRGPYHSAVQQAWVATDTTMPSVDVSHAPAQQAISRTLMHDLVS